MGGPDFPGRLVAGFLLFILLGPVAAAQDGGIPGDAGDEVSTARNILPGLYSGALGIEPGDDDDFYQIQLNQAAIRIGVEAEPSLAVELKILDQNGSILSSDQVPVVRDLAQTYLGWVRFHLHLISGQGNYSLFLESSSLDGGPPDDAGSGIDAGPNSTVALGPGMYHGRLSEYSDDEDRFVIVGFGANRILHVQVEVDSVVIEVLLDGWTQLITNRAEYAVLTSASQNWTLDLIANDFQGNYTIRINDLDPAHDDVASGRDATATSPLNLSTVSFGGRLLADLDAEDTYLYNPASEGTISISAVAATGELAALNVTMAGVSLEGTGSVLVYLPEVAPIEIQLRPAYGVVNYSGVIMEEPLVQNDANSGSDAPDRSDQVGPSILADTPITAELTAGVDPKDFFQFGSPEGQIVTIEIEPPDGANLSLEILKGTVPLASGWATSGPQSSFSASTRTLQLGVTLNSGAGGSYTVELSREELDDANSGRDAGDNPDEAISIGTGTYSSFIGGDDQSDFYLIGGQGGTALTIGLLRPEGFWPGLDLFAGNGSGLPVASGEELPDGSIELIYTPTENDLLWFQVRAGDLGGFYDFSISGVTEPGASEGGKPLLEILYVMSLCCLCSVMSIGVPLAAFLLLSRGNISRLPVSGPRPPAPPGLAPPPGSRAVAPGEVEISPR